MLALFDDVVRTDCGPARFVEPTFTYWNRSGRNDIAEARQTLEQWFREYSAEHASDLRGRFRSRDDAQHQGAVFELFLHALLRRLDCEVEIHPEVPGTTKRPEFRVRCRDQSQFYLEARVVRDESDAQAAARLRTNLIYDAINDLESPDYWINVETTADPPAPVSIKNAKVDLRSKLRALNYDELVSKYEGSGLAEMPKWKYEIEGWSATLFPIPKMAARGQSNLRPLGLQLIPAHWLDTATALRSAILEKAKRYGTPDLPFVVAVNYVGEHIDEIDEVEALFGDEECVITAGDSAKRRFKPNGVWTSPAGQYTRLSGVAVFRKLHAWNFAAVPVRVYHHPNAALPFDGLPQLTNVRVTSGRLEVETGRTIGEVFGCDQS